MRAPPTIGIAAKLRGKSQRDDFAARHRGGHAACMEVQLQKLNASSLRQRVRHGLDGFFEHGVG